MFLILLILISNTTQLETEPKTLVCYIDGRMITKWHADIRNENGEWIASFKSDRLDYSVSYSGICYRVLWYYKGIKIYNTRRVLWKNNRLVLELKANEKENPWTVLHDAAIMQELISEIK